MARKHGVTVLCIRAIILRSRRAGHARAVQRPTNYRPGGTFTAFFLQARTEGTPVEIMAKRTGWSAKDKFIQWLRERKDLYDLDDGPVPKQRLIDKGLFTVVWREFGGAPRPTTKLTGKGVAFYAREPGVRPHGPPSQALLPGL